jgi:hypothetical protein
VIHSLFLPERSSERSQVHTSFEIKRGKTQDPSNFGVQCSAPKNLVSKASRLPCQKLSKAGEFHPHLNCIVTGGALSPWQTVALTQAAQVPLPGSRACLAVSEASSWARLAQMLKAGELELPDSQNLVQVFVSNVLTGTVSRLDLLLDGDNVLVKSADVIASGYLHRPDPATFEVGPTGLAYDQRRDVLYVASTGDNEVFAVKNAGEENQSRGMGQLIYRDQVHLHGALAMVLAPNGHLLVSNSDGINPDQNQPSEIVEFTVQGQFIGQPSVDPAEGGSFGLNIVQATDDVVRFAAVDDNANTITIWKLNTTSLTDSEQD